MGNVQGEKIRADGAVCEDSNEASKSNVLTGPDFGEGYNMRKGWC